MFKTICSHSSSVRMLVENNHVFCMLLSFIFQNMLKIFCSLQSFKPPYGLSKKLRALMGGSCQRSPTKMMFIPPNICSTLPLFAYGRFAQALHRYESSTAIREVDNVGTSSRMSQRIPAHVSDPLASCTHTNTVRALACLALCEGAPRVPAS